MLTHVQSVTSRYFMLPHVTSCYFMSPHNTSQHLTTPHNTSQHLTTPHNTSQHLTTSHNTSQHLTLPHVTSCYLTLPHVTSRYLTLPHVTSRYLTLPHVTSRYLMLFHVTSCHLMLPITRKDMRYFLKSQMDEKNYKKRVEFKKAIDHTKVKTLCQESHYFGMSLLGCFYQFPSFFFVFLTNLTFFIVPVRYNNVSNSLLLSGTCKEAVTFLNIHSR